MCMCPLPQPLGICKDRQLGERQESRQMHAETNLLHVLSSPPQTALGIHRPVLESFFQTLLISSRILLLISNWSSLKNSESLGYRKRMQL